VVTGRDKAAKDWIGIIDSSTVVTSPASEATGLGFESRWRQIISVRGSDGISTYLPYFSSYLMLIMHALVVLVCIN